MFAAEELERRRIAKGIHDEIGQNLAMAKLRLGMLLEREVPEDLADETKMVLELIQQTLDEYQAGIQITQVQLQKVDPPAQVIDAFRDVQAARADQAQDFQVFPQAAAGGDAFVGHASSLSGSIGAGRCRFLRGPDSRQSRQS